MVANEELIPKALEGDQLAYTELHKRTLAIAKPAVCKLLSNYTDKIDIAHDIATKIILNLHKFRGESKFITWAYRVAHNECFMILRKKRYNMLSLDAPLDDTADNAFIDMLVDQNNRYAQIDAKIDLEKILSRLAPGYREVLELKYLYGMSHEEMSLETETTSGSTKSQGRKGMHRAFDIASDLANSHVKDKDYKLPTLQTMVNVVAFPRATRKLKSKGKPRKLITKNCKCGCGGSFATDAYRQLFIPGHVGEVNVHGNV